MAKRLFKTRESWRSWLEKNHASARELWLVYYKKHVDRTSIRYEEAVEEALCFGWIDSKVRRIDDERYMQLYTPRNPKSIWSKLNKKRVAKLVRNGAMTEAGARSVSIAKKNGSWNRLNEIDRAGRSTAVPADLKSALGSSAKAKKFFESLAPSYRKQYLWWIESAKRDETRKKRVAAVVDRCRRGIKPGMP